MHVKFAQRIAEKFHQLKEEQGLRAAAEYADHVMANAPEENWVVLRKAVREAGKAK